MKLSAEALSESWSLPFLRCLSSLSTPDVTLHVHKKGTLHTTDVLNAGWIRTPVPPIHARNGDWLQRKVRWWRRSLECPLHSLQILDRFFFSLSIKATLVLFFTILDFIENFYDEQCCFLGKAQMIMTLGAPVGSLLTYWKVSGISKR